MVQHQLLVNERDLQQLTATIGRVRRMRMRLHDENMRALIGSIEGLPVLPSVCRELNTILAKPDFSIRDLAGVVEKDPSLCAKLLQTVNSSFFSVGRKISTVQDAISYLGTTMLKNLVMSLSLWRSLEEAFVAGLLLDIGETLMIVYLPERYERASKQANATSKPFHEVERELYDVDHAELGAHLLDSWGLPFPVLEAVAFHHSAPELEHSSLETADAVYLAEMLVCARAKGVDPMTLLDAGYLERIGVTQQMPDIIKLLDGP